MLSLQAWVGQTLVASKFESKVLELFAKVGGKYLGTLCLPTRFKEVWGDTVKVLMDLQEQAMKLMPHEWCDAQDVVFYVGATRIVPSGFDYKLTLTSEEAEQARLLLGSTQQIEMVWETNSSYNACLLDGRPNPEFDVFAYFRREAKRVLRHEKATRHFDYKDKGEKASHAVPYVYKKDIPVGLYHFANDVYGVFTVVWAALADLPDGTPCTFSFGNHVPNTMTMGTFHNGRAVLTHALLATLRVHSEVLYDAKVKTTFLLMTRESIDMHIWVSQVITHRLNSTSNQTHSLVYQRGRCSILPLS